MTPRPPPTRLPMATTDKEQDMSKEPFTADQRFRLYLSVIVVLGVFATLTMMTYILSHRW